MYLFAAMADAGEIARVEKTEMMRSELMRRMRSKRKAVRSEKGMQVVEKAMKAMRLAEEEVAREDFLVMKVDERVEVIAAEQQQLIQSAEQQQLIPFEENDDYLEDQDVEICDNPQDADGYRGI